MHRSATPCCLCGGLALDEFLRVDVGLVVTCGGCGLMSMRDESLRPVHCDYDAAYYQRHSDGAVGYLDYFGQERDLRTRVARCFSRLLIKRFPDFVTHLDVGCGSGYLVAAMTEAGRSSWGIDSSSYAIATATELGYRNISCRDPAEEAADGRAYDLVSLMDVIEHAPDPVAFVGAACRLLQPGGALAILTPRVGGRLFVDQQSEYVHFNIDHPYYFTVDTLSAVVEKAAGAAPEVVEVLGELEHLPDCDLDVLSKYRQERDSILALVRPLG